MVSLDVFMIGLAIWAMVAIPGAIIAGCFIAVGSRADAKPVRKPRVAKASRRDDEV